jgi:hypothetical protein
MHQRPLTHKDLAVKNCFLPCLLIATLLQGCSLDNGSSADPPANMVATAGDGKIKVTWTANPGVDYWLFTASDAALTAFNWTGLPNGHFYAKAATPFYVCGLLNGTSYYYAANGRINGGPGGASSATISATPKRSGNNWVTSATSSTNDIYGVGYASLTTCPNNGTSAAGSFVAVGINGTVLTTQSSDGVSGAQSWTSRTVTGGFAHSLNAVTGYAATQNNSAAPNLLWVAVGDGGATVISTDPTAAVWSIGTAFDSTKPTLRAITHVGATFWAVGDAATILSSTDGKTCTAHAVTATTQNLRSITYGNGLYVVTGDNGTILTSADGNTWTLRTTNTTQILRQAASMLAIFVAVGDNGTILTSVDQGVTWTSPSTAVSANNFVGVASNVQLANKDMTGALFANTTTSVGTQNLQFVAIDTLGNYHTSADGLTWSGATSTGIASLNALVSSGFGYVAAGNAGQTVLAF